MVRHLRRRQIDKGADRTFRHARHITAAIIGTSKSTHHGTGWRWHSACRAPTDHRIGVRLRQHRAGELASASDLLLIEAEIGKSLRTELNLAAAGQVMKAGVNAILNALLAGRRSVSPASAFSMWRRGPHGFATDSLVEGAGFEPSVPRGWKAI
jgi:hypothetical protein